MLWVYSRIVQRFPKHSVFVNMFLSSTGLHVEYVKVTPSSYNYLLKAKNLLLRQTYIHVQKAEPQRCLAVTYMYIYMYHGRRSTCKTKWLFVGY